jgi:peptide/nickel transport system substrate-binding protein
MSGKIFRILSVVVILGFIVTACGGAGSPAPAETQAVTEAVQPTQAPAKTEAPAKTQAPAETQAPVATEAPTAAPAASTTNCVRIAGVEASGEKLNLDPINQPSTENSILVEQIYNRLLDMDSDFVVHPELAEKWESNEDGTEWTFHLVKGVKFHDGKELTANDVVYTFKRLIDPASGSEAAATLAFINPDGITAADDYTVVFKLDKPVVEFPVLITTKNTYIVPEGATTESIAKDPNGTGPFMAVDFEVSAQPHVFMKNPNYWEAGLPKADCLEFFAIQEPTTRNAALLSGEVDLVQLVDYATLPTLQGNSSVTLMTTGAATSYVLAMWVDTPPFDDNNVRMAFKKAIDRQAMLDTVLLGYGVIGDDNPVPPTSPYAWRSEAPKQDIEGAKALLAQSGYGPDNPLKVDFYTSEYIPGATALAQLFKEQVAEAGIDVNLVIGPASEHWDNVWLKQPFVGSGWNMRHPGEGLAIAYRSNAQYPETHWYRSDYDALLDQANTEPDPDKRTALYQQAEEMLTEEGGAIIPLFQKSVVAMRSECQGYTPHVQLYKLDLRNISCNH